MDAAAQADLRIAGFAALAIAVHLLESAFPVPVPGIKPGLANVVTLIVLWRWGLAEACAVQALRVVVGSLALGSFLTPGFALALAGAVASLAVLALLHGIGRGRLGPVGYAVPAALAHTGAQLGLAGLWLLPAEALRLLAPPLLAAALGFGILSGMIAQRVLQHLPEPRR